MSPFRFFHILSFVGLSCFLDYLAFYLFIINLTPNFLWLYKSPETFKNSSILAVIFFRFNLILDIFSRVFLSALVYTGSSSGLCHCLDDSCLCYHPRVLLFSSVLVGPSILCHIFSSFLVIPSFWRSPFLSCF